MKKIKKSLRLLPALLCLLSALVLFAFMASCDEKPAPAPDGGETVHTVRILDTDGTVLTTATGAPGTAVTYLP